MAVSQIGSSTVNQLSTNACGIGTYHLANNPESYELQRSNNFEFIVEDIDNIIRSGFLDDDADGHRIPNAQDILRVACCQAPMPHFSQQPIEVRRGNSVIKYAGVPTFSSGNIQIRDFIGAYAKDVLIAWQNLSYNVLTEKVGLITDYKKDAYVIEYSPDYQVVRKWRLSGCWISSINEDDYNTNDNGEHKVSATIEYDVCKPVTVDED